MNDPGEFEPVRLDAITTSWTLVRRAHADTISSAPARNALLMRYSTAIRGYVRALMQDDSTADEVAQDLIVRMLQGDFAGANPERGRFRDFMKVVVKNMVRNYWSRQNRRRPANIDVNDLEIGEEAEEEPFLAEWRNNILNLAWAALEQYERDNESSSAFTLLQLRQEFPDDSSEQLAQRLSDKLGKEVRADAGRQQLKRARRRFADLLIREVADSLEDPSPEAVADELRTVGLYEYVGDILESY